MPYVLFDEVEYPGGRALKKAPKARKTGKHGLRPHEQREQAGAAPALKKPGK